MIIGVPPSFSQHSNACEKLQRWPQHDNFKSAFNTFVAYSARLFFHLVVSAPKSLRPLTLIFLEGYVFRNILFLKHILPTPLGFGLSLGCL